jgi:hypothetical protein
MFDAATDGRLAISRRFDAGCSVVGKYEMIFDFLPVSTLSRIIFAP